MPYSKVISDDFSWLRGIEMQQGKTSIFKWAVRGLVAIVGTVVLAPFAKWGEEQLNLSILSPAIDRVQNWLRSAVSWLDQPVPVQMWELVILLLCVLVALGLMTWMYFDANGKLAALGAELDAANAKLSMPTRAPVSLTSVEMDAFNLFCMMVDAECELTLSNIKEFSGQSVISTTHCLSALVEHGLVALVSARSDQEEYALTGAGREYWLSQAPYDALNKVHNKK